MENRPIYQLSKTVKDKLQKVTQFRNDLIEGSSVQDILEYSDQTLANFYKAAYALFEEKRYEDATHAFLFLTVLNPYNHDFWVGLGMSLQMTHEYERAIDAYELAALADISSPVPYFYLAKCLFAIHDRTSALQALELALETAGDEERFQDLKNQAEHAKKTLLDDQ